MKFVNINGQPLDLTGGSGKKSSGSGRDAYHKGWLAVGWTQAGLDRATVTRERERKEAEAAGKYPLPQPMTVEEYTRTTKPTKLRPKPYEIQDAAETACKLAEKYGWINPHTVAVTKGSAT